MRNFFRFFGLFLVSLLVLGCDPPGEQPAADLSSEALFVFEDTEYDFGVIKQSGGIVSHDFAFTYQGADPIRITSTPGSCLCTKAEIDKKEYQPGDTGVLTVHFNPNLHAEPEGRFYKTVSIFTESELASIPEVRVWQEIDLDLGEQAFELSTHDDGDDHEHDGTEPENHHEEVSHNGQVPALQSVSGVREFVLEAKELQASLADGVEYNYWTFDGTVPGTFLRAREGETIRVTLKNPSTNANPHSIDLHAVNGPGGGATQVFPGQQKSFEFKALNAGAYVYHCATPEVAEHMANGMYGLILIEPKGGYEPVDREYYVMQGEIYSVLDRGQKGATQLSGKKLNAEQPEYMVFNGRVESLRKERALQAEVGDTIRLFVGNGGVSKVSSFHVIGEIFDTVYPEGGTPVRHDVQTTVVPAGGATIVEFTVDVPGTYKLVDHALARLSKGALAELVVTGDENGDVFQAL